MTEELYEEINDELRNRQVWEDKQDVWYRMRYSGIKRAKKPYPNAPDMHYPLADTMIEKLKPLYIAQIYGQERLAAFTSSKPQGENVTSLAEKRFDYVVKQQTNFERMAYVAVDYMLQYGRGPIKTRWNAEAKEIQFSAVRPIFIIVPSWTEDLGAADWLVHVLHLSEAQYSKNKNYKQGEEFIKSIKGRGSKEGQTTNQEQNILLREGITTGQDDKQIVLWEVYSRKDNGDIEVETVSPLLSHEDDPVREKFGLPYKHGQFPFTDLRYEIQDADYYSVRGITEIVSHFELDLCKLWNSKLQFLDFFGQPNFKNTGSGIANPQNFNNAPGRILPQGVEPVINPNAPLDFQQEMQLQRALAEDRLQLPDLSAGQHLTGGKKGGNQQGGGDITATQVNALMSQSTVGNDMRSKVFRLQLALCYRQIWSLICHYIPEEEQLLEDFTQVPKAALHDEYKIMPSGSADSYSKEQRAAKAIAYFQILQGNPNVPQGELTKWLLEQDDSSLIRRLFQEMPDADKAMIQAGAQMVMQQLQSGMPVDPAMAALVLQQGQIFAQKAQANKDQEGMQMLQQLAPLAQALQGIVQQSGQMTQGNVPNGAVDPNAQPQLPNGGAQVPALPAPGQEQMMQQPQMQPAPGVTIALPKVEFDVEQVRAVMQEMAAMSAQNQQPPVVQVNVPQQAPPNITLPPPLVSVQAPPPAEVRVEQADTPSKSKIKIKRDKEGKITGADVERSD